MSVICKTLQVRMCLVTVDGAFLDEDFSFVCAFSTS